MEETTKDTKQQSQRPNLIVRIIKKLVKIAAYIALTIIGLNLLLYLLLSVPFIQQIAVNFATDQLKETLKTDVSIEKIQIKLFSRASIERIYIADQAQDTLLYAQHLETKISPWASFQKGRLIATALDLDNFLIKVNRQDTIGDFNFQFVLDAFASADSVKSDTSSTSFDVDIRDLRLKRGELKYDIYSESETPNSFNAAHIHLYDLNANIDIKSIDVENLNIALNSLAAKEYSGMEISSISGRVRSKESLIWVENLELSMPNSLLKMKQTAYNLDSKEFSIQSDEIDINPKDLIPFFSDLKHLRSKISGSIDLEGKLPQIKLNKLNIRYGKENILSGHASISDYKKIEIADLLISLDELKLSPTAIADFVKLANPSIDMPEMLYATNGLRINGKLEGKLSRFKLKTRAWIDQGGFDLVAHGSIDSHLKKMNILGNFKTEKFKLGALLGEETGLGLASLHTNFSVKQSNQNNLSATVEGVIDSIQYKQNAFRALNIKASYDPLLATAIIDSEQEGIYADINYKQTKIPELVMTLSMKDFELDKLYLNEGWINPSLSLNLKADMKSFDIDEMLVQADLTDLDFHGDNFKFAPGTVSLKMEQLDGNKKDIKLESALFSANLNGKIKMSTVYPEISNILNKSLPAVFDEYLEIKDKERFQNFTYSITINNTEGYSSIFGLPADLIKPMRISGSINTPLEQLRLLGSIPALAITEDLEINDLKLNFANRDSIIAMDATTSLWTSINTYHLNYNLSGGNNKLHNVLLASSDSVGLGMNGQIKTDVVFNIDEHEHLITNVDVLPSDILFGKLNLNLMPSHIEYEHDRFNIDNFAINLNRRDFFGMDGTVSNSPEDSLKVFFAHAQLGDVLKGFDIQNIEAEANGEIFLKTLFKKPEVSVNDFMIYDIAINTDTLGTLSLYSQLHEETTGFEFDATLQKNLNRIAQLKGVIPTRNKNLDIDVFMDGFELDFLEQFTAGLLTKVSGNMSSNIHIGGTTEDPQMKGYIGFNNTSLGVDYTNVIYNVSDTIEITPEYIGFKDLKLTDQDGNIATVNASITHKKFENMKLAMDMNLRNCLILNTMHRTDSLFYGKLYASGRVNIKGDKNKFGINMQVQNGRNSRLNILIPQISEADEYRSVVYINTPVVEKEEPKGRKKSNADLSDKEPEIPVNISLVLDINEELLLGVVIDPLTGDQMDMKGKGNVNFTYDMKKNIMRTFGQYELSDGNVKLNLQNIKRLDFAMRKGSELTFIGDPFKTKFNILAYRRVRADLKTLDYSFEADQNTTRVEVDCELGITGDMNKMDLAYAINLPFANDDQKRRLNSLINTEEERIKQFAYLIAAGTFHSSTGSSGANFTDGMWTSLASSTISSGLNAALGNVLGDKWQIGTTLESSDGTLESMDMSVDVSAKLFDDKLRLKSSLGYRTENSSSTEDSFIGDFEAEYQLTANWILRGYNRTNEKFYDRAPTTQGLGVIYTKDAPSIRQLFQKRRRWRRQQEANTSRDSIPQVQTDSIKPIVSDTLRNEITK